ncbi:MAG: DUF1616 domain-containing protein [Nitrososphaerota archaeon]|jgi:uncharacterized membrane protein|nr:DUF1616 domain-containing protein [Nitrososphaerota archaeon]
MTNKQLEPLHRANIIGVTKNKKLDTIKELMKHTQQKYLRSQGKEITNNVRQIKEENGFNSKISMKLATKKSYITSKGALWFWLTISIVILTVVVVFVVPEDDYPIAYLRHVVGTIFVMLLPGYAFMKVLYPQKMLILSSTKNITPLERMVLSTGLSIAFTIFIGLILNYTPWGIRLPTITICLFVFTVILALIGVLREYWVMSQTIS